MQQIGRVIKCTTGSLFLVFAQSFGGARAQSSELRDFSEVDSSFDCNEGYPNWFSQWKSDKKKWCCDNRGLACPDDSPPLSCEKLGWKELGIPGVCVGTELPCQSIGSFAEANRFCHSRGARLCSTFELLSLAAHTSKCKLDETFAWTGTECGPTKGAYEFVNSQRRQVKCSGGLGYGLAWSGMCCADAQPMCSTKPCEALRWPTADPNTKLGIGLYSVCGSEQKRDCMEKPSSYNLAHAHCESQGARLCSATELLSVEATGCNFNDKLVWSGSEGKNGQHAAVKVFHYGGTPNFTYLDDQDTSKAYSGRCCADATMELRCYVSTSASKVTPTEIPPLPSRATLAPTPPPTEFVPPDGAVFMDTPRSCFGYETEEGQCPHQMPCSDYCKPQDCAFNHWTDWHDLGGCTGLMTRSRSINRVNNECGSPCSGPSTQTKKVDSYHGRCAKGSGDCSFTAWSAWSNCLTEFSQKVRYRDIGKFADPVMGTPCNGSMNETAPCEVHHATDCAFSDWSKWTPCSTACGGGLTQYVRRVIKHAEYGGRPCTGAVVINKPCNTHPCKMPVDCQLGEWSDWTDKCSHYTAGQCYRSRGVLRPPEGSGKPCNNVTKETRACSPRMTHPTADCSLSAWEEWSQCSLQCSRSRERRIADDTGHCGYISLREVATCNTKLCTVKPKQENCDFGSWSSWSECSVTCGAGVLYRKRTLMDNSCSGATHQVQSCPRLPPCSAEETVDCAWGDWHSWSACSARCGGGTQRRERAVQTSPHGPNAKLCTPKETSVIVPCNTQSCGECIDGVWSSWSDWSTCSATCDAGFQVRHRDVAQHPNSCGKAIKGDQDQYRACDGPRPPCVELVNCKMSPWGLWTPCTAKCMGIKERVRTIAVFAKGAGKSCVDAIKEVAPCNPGVGEVTNISACPDPVKTPCQLEDWAAWGRCSSTCGGGVKIRLRLIALPAVLGGAPCEDELEEAGPCNTQKCVPNPQDCKWGLWGAWSSCTQCGGQRFRSRAIIQHARGKGKICSKADAKETEKCISPCTKDKMMFCAWTDWSHFGECQAVCGPSNKYRSRSLQLVNTTELHRLGLDKGYLFKGLGNGMICGGAQSQAERCVTPSCTEKCTPTDCVFSKWADWSAPTCTQLCDRTRVIANHSHCGGDPCEGPLVATKICPHICGNGPIDCLLTQWQSWTGCDAAKSGLPIQQRYRSRDVLVRGSGGGKPCIGMLNQTKRCFDEDKKRDARPCVFGAWTKWGACSGYCSDVKTAGLKSRHRQIKNSSSNGGEGCTGKLLEIEPCSMQLDPVCSKKSDCKVNDWSEWTPCSGLQQAQVREVIEGSVHGGRCAETPLRRIRGCREEGIDCQISPWTEWDDCDRSCLGQRHRSRQIYRSSTPGGKPCPKSLEETEGCNVHACEQVDCRLAKWTEWSDCTATCGTGQESRFRSIAQMPTMYGKKCETNLKEVRPCGWRSVFGKGYEECPDDCLWADWNDWSDCSCTCDGGQRTRDRSIQRYGTKGGRPCLVQDKEMVEPCGTQPCSGVCPDPDSLWEQWTDWGSCSMSCRGGWRWRMRKAVREAAVCAVDDLGKSREEEQCNYDIPCVPSADCKFSEWSLWSDCSSLCFGEKTRHREIAQHAHGFGQKCEGAIKVSRPCHPGSGESVPAKCGGSTEECKLTDWEEWSLCTATCNGGVKIRRREEMVELKIPGQKCAHSLEEVDSCSMQECPLTCAPLDCKWADWGSWGACDKCGGQQKRYRRQMSVAECGGTPCLAAASEETQSCPRRCHEHAWCMWDDWETWGACKTPCGGGTRLRIRHLKVVGFSDALVSFQGFSDEDASIVQGRLQEMQQKTRNLQARRIQEVTVAFACGGLGLLLVAAVVTRLTASLSSSGVCDDEAVARTNVATVSPESIVELRMEAVPLVEAAH